MNYTSFFFFLPVFLFLFQNPFQDPHCIYFLYLLTLLQPETAPQAFLIIHDLDTVVECWSSYFVECLSTWVFLMFPHDYIEVIHIWQKYHRSGIVPLSVHHTRRYLVSASLIAVDVILDHSVNVVATRFLQWKVTISPFVIDYYLGSETLLISCFSSNFCLDYIIHQWSCPTQLLLWCLPNE